MNPVFLHFKWVKFGVSQGCTIGGGVMGVVTLLFNTLTPFNDSKDESIFYSGG